MDQEQSVLILINYFANVIDSQLRSKVKRMVYSTSCEDKVEDIMQDIYRDVIILVKAYPYRFFENDPATDNLKINTSYFIRTCIVIAKRRVYDCWEDTRREVQSGATGREVEESAESSSCLDPATELSKAEEEEKLRKALDKLDPIHRETVQLLHMEGHTHAEVAKIMGCPVGTVQSRGHRGLQKLAKLLKGNSNPDNT